MEHAAFHWIAQQQAIHDTVHPPFYEARPLGIRLGCLQHLARMTAIARQERQQEQAQGAPDPAHGDGTESTQDRPCRPGAPQSRSELLIESREPEPWEPMQVGAVGLAELLD